MNKENTVVQIDDKRRNLCNLTETIRKEKSLNNMASNYYRKKNFWLVIPSIVITGLCSIGSFIASSNIINDDTKTGFTIGVGVLTIVATTLQSLSNSLGYGARSEMFRKSADVYDKLLTRVEFEISQPNESDFLKKIEERILNVKDECKYLPPEWMEQKLNETSPLLSNINSSASNNLITI